MQSACGIALSLLALSSPQAVAEGWSRLAFQDGEPVGLFKTVVAELQKPSDDAGASMSADELKAILDDPRAKEIYRPELVKYATPKSVQIQNAEHKSYLKIFMRKDNLQKGVAFLAAHTDELERAEARFGVKPKDIVSILMWESQLGVATGKFLVVNVYVGQILFLDEVFQEIEKTDHSLPPGPARDKHVKRLERLKENAAKFLVALLRSAKAKHVDPLLIRGSWAGAIGFVQFMPTSMHWAVDGDGDGKIDLYSFPDAIFSVASYLEAHGYKKDRAEAIHGYNADHEYVRGVQLYADTIAKQAQAKAQPGGKAKSSAP